MKVYIFGNPDLSFDSAPVKIFPKLESEFPHVQFIVKDPNEEISEHNEVVIIDTVQGITSVKVFESLAEFAPHPHVTLHDFDAYSNLRFLQKLGKLKKIKIIGVPPTIDANEAFIEVSAIFRSTLL